MGSALRVNIAVYFATNIAVAIIPFILLPILTRYLGPEGYGVVSMFLTVVTMLGAIIGLNSHNGLTVRWFDREGVDFSQYVAACIIILIASGMFVGLFFLGMQDWLVLNLSLPVFWLYTTILVAASAFLLQIRLVLWQVQEKPFKYGILQIGNAFLNGVLSYILVVIFLLGYEGRIWGHVIAVFFFGNLSIFLLSKDGFFQLRTQWKYIKDALIFGVPLIPHVVGGFFLLMADRMIVNAKLGTSNAGVYMVAVQIALGFNLLNESFNKAFVPRLFANLKSNKAETKIFIVKCTYGYFLLLLVAPLVTFFWGKYVVVILAGPDFTSAAPVLTWLVLMQSFHGMYYLVTNYLFYECKTYITSVITIISGSVSLILTLWLVDKLGLIGAGISSAIGMFLQFIMTWVMAAKVHPMPWFPLKIFKKQTV